MLSRVASKTVPYSHLRNDSLSLNCLNNSVWSASNSVIARSKALSCSIRAFFRWKLDRACSCSSSSATFVGNSSASAYLKPLIIDEVGFVPLSKPGPSWSLRSSASAGCDDRSASPPTCPSTSGLTSSAPCGSRFGRARQQSAREADSGHKSRFLSRSEFRR